MNHPPVYTCGLLLEHDDVTIAYKRHKEDIPDESRDLLKEADIDLLFLDAIAPANSPSPNT